MSNEFEQILSFLNKTHGFDFSRSRYTSLERKIINRMASLKINTAEAYIKFLDLNSEEMVLLIDLLTINVSHFFRNSLTFEHLAKRTLPTIITNKIKTRDNTLRIWSAGCANGEEPYSIAMLINEILEKEVTQFDLNIFATDINKKVLQKAKEGIFLFEQVKNVKHGLINKYFKLNENHFSLHSKIRDMVTFSFYDMIDSKTYVPPESVFGNFDLVLCRNLLIYFQAERQRIIFDKLFRALIPGGYLVLGEAEKLPAKFEKYFLKENDYNHIYRKKLLKEQLRIDFEEIG